MTEKQQNKGIIEEFWREIENQYKEKEITNVKGGKKKKKTINERRF